MKIKILILVVLCISELKAQLYNDYIGAGHNSGITVTASSFVGTSSPSKTLDGSGMDSKLFDASRFLAQSTFGAKLDQITHFRDNWEYEAWINDQFTKPTSYMTPKMETIWQQVLDESDDPDSEFGPSALHFNYAWWENNLNNQDLLRQRVAYALSQILVISYNSDLSNWAESITSYYDLLVRHSFGNYRNLLLDITKHPSMGYYLSHLNNPKTNTATGTSPDQNFAREIMQLFTIGLVQLNQNGTPVLDGNGNPTPTYTNADISELAKVFTGLMGGGLEEWVDWKSLVDFGDDIGMIDKELPMVMYQPQHEPGVKSFLGHTIPANQPGMTDITSAVDFLFNHPNTAPFVSYRLIQRLVKSNPSQEYIGRVASAFANNGQNVRGDMRAVIKAILLDEEARSSEAMMNRAHGKLREPMLKFTNACRIFPLYTTRNRYWNNGYDYYQSTRQHVMYSPNVFNFYLPDFSPVGDITNNDLVAPEFKLHNTSTGITYINTVNGWAGGVWYEEAAMTLHEWGALFWSWNGTPGNDDLVRFATSELLPYAHDSEYIINDLDKRLTHGQLTDETRQIMRDALNGTYWSWDTVQQTWRFHRIRSAIYMFMISPDYNILK
ncbi:MAG: DUF1800 domain-containing protein [Saprospiraceae bacterium]|nr:DUF1800 domain-containing protein [Saprospiraceae bacterium]